MTDWHTIDYADPALCDDCPPRGYPTDKTRCAPCPRRTVKPTEDRCQRCETVMTRENLAACADRKCQHGTHTSGQCHD